MTIIFFKKSQHWKDIVQIGVHYEEKKRAFNNQNKIFKKNTILVVVLSFPVKNDLCELNYMFKDLLGSCKHNSEQIIKFSLTL